MGSSTPTDEGHLRRRTKRQDPGLPILWLLGQHGAGLERDYDGMSTMTAAVQSTIDAIALFERQMIGAFLDQLAVAACLLEPLPGGNLCIIASNGPMDEMLAFNGRLSGRTIDEVLPPPAAEELRVHAHESISSRTAVEWNGCLTVADKRRWWRTLVVPLIGPRGRVMGTVAIVTDISTKRAEEIALRNERDRLRDALESINEGFALWDADDRLIFANRRYASLYSSMNSLPQPGESYETLLRAAVSAGQLTRLSHQAPAQRRV